MRKKLNGRAKTILKFLVGVVISFIIVYFTYATLGSFNPSELFANHINWIIVAFSVLALHIATFLRSMVFTFGIDRDMSWFDSWRIITVGNAANMVLPLKMGEGIRLALFPKGYKAMKRLKLTLVPAMIDTVIILLFCAASVFFAGFRSARVIRLIGNVTLVLLTLILLGFFVLWMIPVTNRAIRNFMDADARRMIVWVAVSWIFVYLSVWLGILALDYGVADSFRLALATIASMNILTMFPTSPGGIGVFEYSIVFGLTGLGMAQMPAKAIGLLEHIIQYLTIFPLGVLLYFVGLGPVRRKFGFKK